MLDPGNLEMKMRWQEMKVEKFARARHTRAYKGFLAALKSLECTGSCLRFCKITLASWEYTKGKGEPGGKTVSRSGLELRTAEGHGPEGRGAALGALETPGGRVQDDPEGCLTGACGGLILGRGTGRVKS